MFGMKRFFLPVLLLITFLSSAVADDLGPERDKMRAILKNVASEVQKNYYDPNLKGLDWKALTDQAKLKIDNARSVSDMLVAIYVLVDKLQDSHTHFMPPARAVKLFYGFDAKAIGDDIRIFELKRGDVAERAGLKIGDKIIKMNGFGADRASFDLMMINYRLLRPRGVWELVVQTGNEPPRTVSLEARQKQEARVLEEGTIDSSFWDFLSESQDWDESHKYVYGSFDGGIGYVWIREFPTEAEDFLKGLMDKIKGSKAVIVDLRSNPGGAVDTLKNFIGVFEKEEVTVIEMVGRKKSEPMIAKPQRPNFAGLPMYILIDSRTGSSAEIFARHFQRTGKAIVVGDNSPGRAVVSKGFGGQYGAYNAVLYGIQIGIARAVFPGGEEIEGKGVKPDVYCVPTGEDMLNDRDVCLSMAASAAREKLGVKPAVADTKPGAPSGH